SPPREAAARDDRAVSHPGDPVDRHRDRLFAVPWTYRAAVEEHLLRRHVVVDVVLRDSSPPGAEPSALPVTAVVTSARVRPCVQQRLRFDGERGVVLRGHVQLDVLVRPAACDEIDVELKVADPPPRAVAGDEL